MSFQSLGLSQALLDAISKKGYTTPSPIQSKAIPPILEGKDVLASAQTGTGKTAGFVLPILELLSKPKENKTKGIRALILTPTRELADQVSMNVRQYGAFLRLRSCVIYGGVSQHTQVAQLKQGVDILIATPGRLLDLENQRLLSLASVEIVVLDEADRMLDMGFSRDLDKIMELIPGARQTLLFSATFSQSIKRLSNNILTNPTQIEILPDPEKVVKIDQKIYRVAKSLKTQLLIKMIEDENWEQALVFTTTKHGANKLCDKLLDAGISASCIHGNKTQMARSKALASLKSGKIRVLVATDVAARGLDIPLLPHVVNFELPNVAENYVHRIGRTGRAGASGVAISFVSHDEGKFLRDIERFTNTKMVTEVIEGFAPEAVAPTSSFQGNFERRSSGGSSHSFNNGNSLGGYRSGGGSSSSRSSFQRSKFRRER